MRAAAGIAELFFEIEEDFVAHARVNRCSCGAIEIYGHACGVPHYCIGMIGLNMMMKANVAFWLIVSAGAAQVRLSESTGVNLFANNCTTCHGATPAERAPTEATIKQMPPERIYEAITTGSMKTMAQKLSEDEKRRLAEYMGGRKNGPRGGRRHEEHAESVRDAILRFAI